MPPSIKDIAVFTGAHFHVPVEDLRGPRRQQSIARARQCAFALCNELCKDVSLNQIGKFFGGRDHTTVKHGIAAVARRKTAHEMIFLHKARFYFAQREANRAPQGSLREVSDNLKGAPWLGQ